MAATGARDHVHSFKEAWECFAVQIKQGLPILAYRIIAAADRNAVYVIFVYVILLGVEAAPAKSLDVAEPQTDVLPGHFLNRADVNEQIRALVGQQLRLVRQQKRNPCSLKLMAHVCVTMEIAKAEDSPELNYGRAEWATHSMSHSSLPTPAIERRKRSALALATACV